MDDLVARALHASRQHFEGGGLSDLFSGPDIMSTGDAPSPGDWGNPDVASDFFKADKAMRLAQQAQAQAQARDEDATGSIPQPSRRAPAEPAQRQQIAAATPAPAPQPEAVSIPFTQPDKAYAMLGADGAPRPFLPTLTPVAQDAAPMAFASTATPTPAPAQAAIDTAMTVAPKLTDRAAAQPGMADLTPQQTDYIIRTIAAESSGDPDESKGIANVIMNRINSGRFGATPEHVLFNKRQFEPWGNKSLANYPLKIKPGTDRYQAAAEALDAALQGEDNTGGATFFWGPGSQYALGRKAPGWAKDYPDYTDIGATRFHREGRAEGGSIVDHALMLLSRRA